MQTLVPNGKKLSREKFEELTERVAKTVVGVGLKINYKAYWLVVVGSGGTIKEAWANFKENMGRLRDAGIWIENQTAPSVYRRGWEIEIKLKK